MIDALTFVTVVMAAMTVVLQWWLIKEILGFCFFSCCFLQADDLVKYYPNFVNYFEKTKEILMRCDKTKPRFHAFLRVSLFCLVFIQLSLCFLMVLASWGGNRLFIMLAQLLFKYNIIWVEVSKVLKLLTLTTKKVLCSIKNISDLYIVLNNDIYIYHHTAA